MWILPRRFADMTIFDIKLIVAYSSVIYTPRSRIAQYVAVAKGANVHIADHTWLHITHKQSLPHLDLLT